LIPAEPLFTVHVRETEGADCFLVVHSVRRGSACGGVRAAADVTLEEVQQLARVMTYKYAFWDRPMGGAKAGVRLPDGLSRDERLGVFRRLGERLAPILRANLYYPWPDLNCGPSEIGAMLAGAGLPVGVMPDTAYYTALTVFGSLVATAEFLGLRPRDCRVTIEGLGRVGMQLAREVRDWGGKLVAASTAQGTIGNPGGLDIEAVERARERKGDAFVSGAGEWERLPREELFGVPADILVPCARVGSINAAVAARVEAKALVPGANAPYTDEGEVTLARRGVVLLPDFVCNSGGVMGTRLAHLGVAPGAVRELLVGKLGKMVRRVLEASEQEGVSAAALARRVAEERYAAGTGQAYAPSGIRAAIARRLSSRIPRSYRRRHAVAEFLRVARSRFPG
jgi:glutamate dehydrogenase/leucine dehydrogenase